MAKAMVKNLLTANKIAMISGFLEKALAYPVDSWAEPRSVTATPGVKEVVAAIARFAAHNGEWSPECNGWLTVEDEIAEIMGDGGKTLQVSVDRGFKYFLARLKTLKNGEAQSALLSGSELLVLAVVLTAPRIYLENLHEKGLSQVMFLPATEENKVIAADSSIMHGAAAESEKIALMTAGTADIKTTPHGVIGHLIRLCRDEAEVRGPKAQVAKKSPPQPVMAKDMPVPDRFEILGDFVFDKQFNITWQRCSVGQRCIEGNRCKGHAQVLEIQEALNLQRDGWRLPNKEELASLVDRANIRIKDKVKINEKVFPGTPRNGCWSKTRNQGFSTFGIDFADGTVHSYSGGGAAVRLVKDGKP